MLLAAVGFGGWPVIARYAGVSPTWANLILMMTTTTALLLYKKLWVGEEPVTPKQIALMTGAGLLNFTALVAFGVVLTKYPKYIPPAQALMPIVTFVGCYLMLSEQFSARQTIGMALIFVGIYLLTAK